MRNYLLKPFTRPETTDNHAANGELLSVGARERRAVKRLEEHAAQRPQLAQEKTLKKMAGEEAVHRQEAARRRRERALPKVLDTLTAPWAERDENGHLTYEPEGTYIDPRDGTLVGEIDHVAVRAMRNTPRRTHREVAAKVYQLFDPTPVVQPPAQPGPLFDAALGTLRETLGSHGGHFCEDAHGLIELLTPAQREAFTRLSPLQKNRLSKQWRKNPWQKSKMAEGRHTKELLAEDLQAEADAIADEYGWWRSKDGEWRWPDGRVAVLARQDILDDPEITAMHPPHAPGVSSTVWRAQMELERARRRIVHRFLFFRNRAESLSRCGQLTVQTTAPEVHAPAAGTITHVDDKRVVLTEPSGKTHNVQLDTFAVSLGDKVEAGDKLGRGGAHTLVQHELGGVLADAFRCGWRFCPSCARRSAQRTRLRLARALAAHGIDPDAGSTDDGKQLLMLTFTQRDLESMSLDDARQLTRRAQRWMSTRREAFRIDFDKATRERLGIGDDHWRGFWRPPPPSVQEQKGFEWAPSLTVGGMSRDEFTFSTPETRKKKARTLLRQADELLCDPEKPWSGDWERVEKLRSESVRLEEAGDYETWHHHTHALIEPGEGWPTRVDGKPSIAIGQHIAKEIWRLALDAIAQEDALAERQAKADAFLVDNDIVLSVHQRRRLRTLVRRAHAAEWVVDEKNGGVNVQVPRSGLMEVAKYIIKPLDLASYPPARRREIIRTFEGQQMVRRWGTWRGNAFTDVFDADDDTGRPLTEEEIEGLRDDPRVDVAADLDAASTLDEDEEGVTVNTALTGAKERRVGWLYGTDEPVTRGELTPSSSPWHREQAREHFERQWQLRQITRVLDLVVERPHWPLRPPQPEEEDDPCLGDTSPLPPPTSVSSS